jgi:tRNA threonylcarbamoyladenosine biosynthesis protein TsaE
MVHESRSVADTERIAADLARTLRAGSCVALEGDLGAGKTQFVRGLVRALDGNPRAVSSPTFTLLNVYPTPALQVFHLDAYRVAGPDDFESIGFEELLDQSGIVVVEWASRVAAMLPPDTIHINIESTDEATRRITITARQYKPASG